MFRYMEKSMAFDPMYICFFGPDAVVPDPNGITDLIEEFRLRHNRLPALFEFTIRLPIFQSSHCIDSYLASYTPENPSRQNAFRVSTYS